MKLNPEKFSGIAHTLVYRPHEGFANYAVATLKISEGIVEEITLSDPYAGFEAMAKMELLNEKKLEEMRKNYPPEYRHV